MSVQKVSTGYVPRDWQAKLHRTARRFNVFVFHRRAGKTVFSINHLIDKSLKNKKKNPKYAYVAPTYAQAKKIAWDYFKEYTRNIPGVTVNESELRITVQRGEDKIQIYLLGAENPDSIRGLYLDGVILDEYADMHPDTWGKVIRPALSDRQGWAIFIGTPKGLNDFKEKYDYSRSNKDLEWLGFILRASESKLIPEWELRAMQNEMTEEEYAQEMECDFGAALVGAYYGKQMNKAEKDGRIRAVPYDPHVPVDTFWDLGIGDSNSIWFAQVIGDEYHLIDYVEDSGEGLEYYVKLLQEKGYIYGEHVFPHDVRARSLDTGRTREDALRSMGLQNIRILEKLPPEDRIHAARMLLDRCYFDASKCARGINCLINYQRKWDAKNQIFNNSPLHNWASHGADAFGYFALGIRQNSGRMANRQDLPRSSVSDYNELDY